MVVVVVVVSSGLVVVVVVVVTFGTISMESIVSALGSVPSTSQT